MDAVQAVLAARSAILDKAGAIGVTRPTPNSGAPGPAGGFGALLDKALAGVKASQASAGQASVAFERGATDDIAGVMLKRQTAAIDFQAALQIRNRLLGAYRDIMNMPV